MFCVSFGMFQHFVNISQILLYLSAAYNNGTGSQTTAWFLNDDTLRSIRN